MNKLLLSLTVLAFGALILGFTAGPDSEEEMIAAAKAVDQQFIDGWTKGDIDTVMATYWNSPELISFPPDQMEIRGWDAVKAGMAQAIAGMQSGKMEFLNAEYRVEGSVVLCSGKWRYTMPMPEGEPMVMEGRFTDVKAKRDGKMVIIMDHASVPMPAPEMSEMH